MSLSIGIVGLPNVGKSTLFNAMTKSSALVANYPFATIDPNVGVVQISDFRLDKLAEMFNSKQTIYATVEFTDIAGIIKGAASGEGLGNKFLANIRETDAICMVTRGFIDDNVIRESGPIDPQGDIEVITTELILADLQTIENAIGRLEKDLRGAKIEKQDFDLVLQAKDILESGQTLFAASESSAKKIDRNDPILRDLHLLTAKPFIYVFNIKADDLTDNTMIKELSSLVYPAQAIFLDAQFEAELVELDEQDATELLESIGQKESGLDKLTKVGFDTLGLQVFFTAGEKEARAWTIRQGWSAKQAAGVIHSDFEQKFIKADIVSYNDLITAGSLLKAREAGKVRSEGKEYIMQPFDVTEFKHGA